MKNKFFISLFFITLIVPINAMKQNDIHNPPLLETLRAHLATDFAEETNGFIKLFKIITKEKTRTLNFDDKNLVLKADKQEIFAGVLFPNQLSILFDSNYGDLIKKMCSNHLLFKLYPNENTKKISFVMEVTRYDKEWEKSTKIGNTISHYHEKFIEDNKN